MFENVYRVESPLEGSDWGWALPSVVRVIADPSANVGLPACPLLRQGNHDTAFRLALGYWSALDHLLRYQLGWTHPAQGLARWLDEGLDMGGTPLDLVRQIWLGDGFLLRYLAWRLEKTVDHVPGRWRDRVASTYEYGKEGEPIGPWQLHLEEHGMHVLSPNDSSPPEQLLVSIDPASNVGNGAWTPDVTIIFDDPAGLESGWYGFLSEFNVRHTSVDVYAKRFGYCGPYRRSPLSGRWHTVREPVHQWGVRV